MILKMELINIHWDFTHFSSISLSFNKMTRHKNIPTVLDLLFTVEESLVDSNLHLLDHDMNLFYVNKNLGAALFSAENIPAHA